MLEHVRLRRPEPKDVDKLYVYRNDCEIVDSLGGFSMGYSVQDLLDWIEFHRSQSGEVIWIIADKTDDACLGHVGLYNIDHRVRKAEFAILIGEKNHWGHGLGQTVTAAVMDYGFDQLNLHRIELEVLASNARAIHIYEKLGFKREGVRRDAQFRSGHYFDVVLMAILEHERNRR